AQSGLPALAVPAGMTPDEVPIGMDLLGGAFKEQDLLSLGYSIAPTLHGRHPPFSTPALAGGKRPAPRTMETAFEGSVVTLSYDASRSELQYTVKVAPTSGTRLSSVWIHGGTTDKPGAARHRL